MRQGVQRIDIDRIVFDGVEMTHREAESLRPVLESELASRVASRHLAPSDCRDMPPHTIVVGGTPSRDAGELCTQVAKSIATVLATESKRGH